jgi:hypothetical protein
VNRRPVERITTRSDQSESSGPNTYARLLQRCGYGYPIWIPEGAQNLSESHRERGISIGDVGYIRTSGSFKVLFNILEHADQGVNARQGTGTVPDGFQPLKLEADDEIEISDSHQADTTICSPSMQLQITSSERNDGATS